MCAVHQGLDWEETAAASDSCAGLCLRVIGIVDNRQSQRQPIFDQSPNPELVTNDASTVAAGAGDAMGSTGRSHVIRPTEQSGIFEAGGDQRIKTSVSDERHPGETTVSPFTVYSIRCTTTAGAQTTKRWAAWQLGSHRWIMEHHAPTLARRWPLATCASVVHASISLPPSLASDVSSAQERLFYILLRT